jgi:hypothetical protein
LSDELDLIEALLRDGGSGRGGAGGVAGADSSAAGGETNDELSGAADGLAGALGDGEDLGADLEQGLEDTGQASKQGVEKASAEVLADEFTEVSDVGDDTGEALSGYGLPSYRSRKFRF